MKSFFLTTGDQDGIGPEVTAKSLLRLKSKLPAQPIVWRGSESAKTFAPLARAYRRVIVSSPEDALDLKPRAGTLIEIESQDSPARWIEDAAALCLKDKSLAGLATAPLSKTLIFDSGMKDLGHTEILARVSKTKAVFQGYAGSKFNVVLVTAHAPLARVPKLLTRDRVRNACWAAHAFQQSLGPAARRKPMAILGLNPHAGEKGLIGGEEKELTKWIPSLRGTRIEGPLVPDAAFLEKNWSKYSVFISLYHDQGLIPFKMIHGKESGAQVTLGLPFIRTSVDHGTAKDLFGKNKADPGSMIDAIKLCLKLSGGSHV